MMVTTTTTRQPGLQLTQNIAQTNINSLLDEDRKAADPVRDRDPPTRKSRNEVEYHSDKYFTNYFLNSNPKLEEMLTKVESQ